MNKIKQDDPIIINYGRDCFRDGYKKGYERGYALCMADRARQKEAHRKRLMRRFELIVDQIEEKK
jgi:hypothetical protein